jgi:hypothetical protein
MSTLDELVQNPKLSQNVLHYAAAFHRLKELKEWRRALAVATTMRLDPAMKKCLEASDAATPVEEMRSRYRQIHNEALEVKSPPRQRWWWWW